MNKVLKMMKEFYKKENLKENNLTFPEKMHVKLDDNEESPVCEITLNAECVKKDNMQVNNNAFEGWSIAIYTALKVKYNNIKIRLCLDDYSLVESTEVNGHLARFLYRAERFCKQYMWFELSDELCKALEEKGKVFQKHTYINNVPNGHAGIKNTHNNENVIEAKLAEKGILEKVIDRKVEDFGSNQVYRQLPVGLFRNNVETKNSVFPGRGAAIDLWSWNHDTFHVIELKASNPMIGIITEIFFYANYMRDFLVKKEKFTLNPEINKEDRGYRDIWEQRKEFKKINGIMLADEYHPVLENQTQEILDVMNNNGDIGIRYYKIDYGDELCVVPKEGTEDAK